MQEPSIQKLKEKEQALQSRLDAIYRDYRKGLDADGEERAQQLQNAETLNEIERVTAEELDKVRTAIRTLEESVG